MREMAPLSKVERVKYINEKFPDTNITLHYLNKLYKANKVRYKDIRVIKRNIYKYSDEDMINMTNKLREEVKTYKDAGYEIIKVDESLFYAQD